MLHLQFFFDVQLVSGRQGHLTERQTSACGRRPLSMSSPGAAKERAIAVAIAWVNMHMPKVLQWLVLGFTWTALRSFLAVGPRPRAPKGP